MSLLRPVLGKWDLGVVTGLRMAPPATSDGSV
jgi:hypothetical protein